MSFSTADCAPGESRHPIDATEKLGESVGAVKVKGANKPKGLKTVFVAGSILLLVGGGSHL